MAVVAKRKITFSSPQEDKESSVDFVTLYSIFIGNQNSPNKANNLEELKRGLEILDAFDNISNIAVEGDMETRSLKLEGGEFIITESAHKVLQKLVDEWVSKAPFSAARLAIRIKNRIDSASVVSD